MVSRGSPVASVIRRPTSCKNSLPVRLMGPSDSMATGTNSCVEGRDEYLACLRSAACSAAPQAIVDVRWTYDAAHVWMAVASHVIYFPLDQGINVAPSGLLPSVRIKPGGSLELGIPAFESARQMMSLIAACRAALPTDFLHSKP